MWRDLEHSDHKQPIILLSNPPVVEFHLATTTKTKQIRCTHKFQPPVRYVTSRYLKDSPRAPVQGLRVESLSEQGTGHPSIAKVRRRSSPGRLAFASAGDGAGTAGYSRPDAGGSPSPPSLRDGRIRCRELLVHFTGRLRN